MTSVDTGLLELKVKDMYRLVAKDPQGPFHFEMGRPLAERLGYPPDVLAGLPGGAVESFAGVGYFFDLAGLHPGDRVVDLGSGSGMDSFFAAATVGPEGRVVGIDFTEEQVGKARLLAQQAGMSQVEFVEGRIESTPFPDGSFDCVISNGVINLCPDKGRVFAEAARLLRPGGRLAVADIVTERQLKEGIVEDAELWAACIGGATQQDDYQELIERSGLRLTVGRRNPYTFLSDRARSATTRYGVHSISLVALKPDR